MRGHFFPHQSFLPGSRRPKGSIILLAQGGHAIIIHGEQTQDRNQLQQADPGIDEVRLETRVRRWSMRAQDQSPF